MFGRFQIVLGLTTLFLYPTYLYTQETCASNSSKPYEWPGQRNWFMAPNLYSGVVINMETMGVTSVGGPGNSVTSYEGVSAASNDKGELLFYTNGRSLWTGTGGSVTKTYGGLLTGNEWGLNNGSAAQGVITVRHPLDPARYWVITTDDALAPTKGMNAFSFDTLGNLLSGPTRLGTFRTSEGISATLHSNGVDVWVTCLASGTSQFHTFLLKCDGFESESVVSPIGPNVTGNKERGGISYSWDGEYLAQAHPNWWPDGDKIVSIYRFNKSTGELYDAKNVSGVWGSPYDIAWSPNNQRVYVSMQNSAIHYLDISNWNVTSIKNSWTSTGVSSKFTAIEVGYDESLYLSHGQAGGGYLKKMNGDLNSASSFTTSNVAGTGGMSHLGLPTIYIPPSDEPDIQEVGPYCTTDPPVDLNTLWICSGNDAENPSENPLAYSGIGIIDRANGIFDPSAAGPGTHQIIFEYCSVNDTTWITVNNCTSCIVNIEDVQPEICIGESLILDAYVINTSGTGEWSIDSFPIGISPTIINGLDTIFDASNLAVASGTYKLKFTVADGSSSCYDSIYIIVNPVPTPDLGPDQSICGGSGFVTFDVGLYSSYLWQPNSETSQTITTDVSGDYVVTVTDANNCTASDTVTLTSHPLPTPDLGPDQSICGGSGFVTFDAGSYGSYLWQPNSETSQTITTDVSGDYIVRVTDANNCTASDTVTLTSHPLPTPDLGPDQSICGGSGFVTFDAGLYSSYLWQPNSETSQTITTDVSGDYIVRVTDANNCTASDTVTLTSHPLPTPDLGPDIMVCPGVDTTLYIGSNWQQILWNDLSSGDSLKVFFGGTYYVDVIDLNGCSASDTLNFVFLEKDQVNLGNDITICQGAEATFNIGTYSNYLWHDGSSGIQYISSSQETIWVEVKDTNGCISKDTAQVFISESLPVNLGPDSDFCEGDSIVVSSGYPEIGYTFTWSTAETKPDITINSSGVYDVLVEDIVGCTGRDTVVVTMNERPIIDLGIDKQICIGSTSLFNAGSGWVSTLWNTSDTISSITVSDEGYYSVTVQDINGCLSSDTAYLSVYDNPSPDLGDDQIICSSSSALFTALNYVSYVWHNGDTLDSYSSNQEENVYVTVTDSNGCIGSDTAEIIVREELNIDLGPDLDTCNQNSMNLSSGYSASLNTFLWNTGETSQDILINSSGTYFVRVTDINGCEGSDTILISLHQTPTVDLGSNKTICDGGSILLDAGLGWSDILWSDGYLGQINSVKTSGNYSVRVIDSNGCEGTDEMTLTVNPIPTMSLGPDVEVCTGDGFTFSTTPNNFDSYLWHDGSDSQQFETNNPQVISVLVTDQNGCLAADTIRFTNLPLVEVNLPSNQIICDGEMYEILVPDFDIQSHTFLWSDASTNSSLQVQTAGSYSVYVTNADGCVGFDSITIGVHSKPTPLVGNVGICENETAILGTGFYESYSWNSGQETREIEVGIEGVYTVTVEDSNGCLGRGSGTLTIHNNPAISAPDNQVFCQGGEVTLFPSLPDGNYYWKPGGETTPSIEVSVAGDYEVVVQTVFGCSDSVSINVVQKENPSIDLGPDTTICDGQTVFAGFEHEGSIITWNTGDVSDSIEINTTGVFEATIMDLNNCIGKDTIRVNVSRNPSPNAPNDTLVCFQEIGVLPLTVVAGARDQILWSTGDTTNDIFIDAEGVYEVLATNLDGCVGKDTIEVIRECPSLLWIPNAFTPDQDGINDFFGPKAINIYDFDFYVFNRWGELLFHSTNIENQWDGTFKGSHCQIDIYVWKLYYRTEEEHGGLKRQVQVGNVTLLR